MKFAIRHRYSGSVLFALETESLKMCVEAAIQGGADLQDADLRCEDLRGADLRGADLLGADLLGANLQDADLRGADLRGADIRDANLRGADLHGADLVGANLWGADLRGAKLLGAKLVGADLQDAKGINKHRCTPLTILLDQPGKIRAYKLVNGNMEGPYQGGITYKIGKSYQVDNANTDDTEHCGAGINVATLDWCMREWCDGYRILIVEFEAADIAAIPIATDGKFRLHRCKVVGEKDLKEIGLAEEAPDGLAAENR